MLACFTALVPVNPGGVVGLELLGVVGNPTFKPDKAIVNAPRVVGVTAFTGLTPGIVGVVGVEFGRIQVCLTRKLLNSLKLSPVLAMNRLYNKQTILYLLVPTSCPNSASPVMAP